MSFLTVLLAVILGVFIGGVLQHVAVTTLLAPKKPMMPMMPKPNMTDVLAELNMLIKLECVGVIDIPQSVKNIPLIRDFNAVQQEIIHVVLNSLSQNFWMTCNMAGLTRLFIITYVTRSTHAEMISFIEQHNFSLNDNQIVHTNIPMDKTKGE